MGNVPQPPVVSLNPFLRVLMVRTGSANVGCSVYSTDCTFVRSVSPPSSQTDQLHQSSPSNFCACLSLNTGMSELHAHDIGRSETGVEDDAAGCRPPFHLNE